MLRKEEDIVIDTRKDERSEWGGEVCDLLCGEAVMTVGTMLCNDS